MKERAMNYLSKNPLIHMSMIEPIRRNTAEIIYADEDGVLIKEKKSNAYMISTACLERGRSILEPITEGMLFVAHQGYLRDFIASEFSLEKEMECVQANVILGVLVFLL